VYSDERFYHFVISELFVSLEFDRIRKYDFGPFDFFPENAYFFCHCIVGCLEESQRIRVSSKAQRESPDKMRCANDSVVKQRNRLLLVRLALRQSDNKQPCAIISSIRAFHFFVTFAYAPYVSLNRGHQAGSQSSWIRFCRLISKRFMPAQDSSIRRVL